MTWQPIATAPVNVAVLVYVPMWAESMHVATHAYNGTWWFACVNRTLATPTHWMSLPDPPTEATQ